MTPVGLNALPMAGSPRRHTSWISENETSCAIRDSITDGDQRILVPLDGTRAAEHSLPYAIALSRRSGAILQLVQVYSYFDDFRDHGLSWGDENPVRTVRDPRERYLARVVRRISRYWDIPVVANLIQDDSPERALRDLHSDAGLTIMTSRRRTWLSRFFRGSIVDSLLASSKRPVLLVEGHDAPVELTGDPDCRHVLSVIESMDDLPSNVDELWLAPRPREGQVTMLPLNEAVVGPLTGWVAARRQESLQILVETVPATTAHQVIDYAERQNVDLITLPHLDHLRARPWEDRAALRAVAAGSPVPVLVRGARQAAVATATRFERNLGPRNQISRPGPDELRGGRST